MTTQQHSFKYGKSYKIIHWGCTFDSLLELKFAISIQDDYEFLRSRVHIYYDQRTMLPTNYIRPGIMHYTPDFLIRHKQTKKAFLVEVKPDLYSDKAQLVLRRQVAENYIRWKNYDWNFRLVYGNEIVLSTEQNKAFEACCQLKSKSAFKIKFREQNKKYDRSAPTFFKNIPVNTQPEFVMFGTGKYGL